MKLTVVPESLIDCVGLLSGRAPTPFFDTMVALMLARTVMLAAKVGIFDTLATGPRTIDEVACFLCTHAPATQKLMRALVALGYINCNGNKYELARTAEKWLLSRRPRSFRDGILLRFLDAQVMEHYECFLKTGRSAEFHKELTDEEWHVYQAGQASHASLMAWEVVRRAPVPSGAKTLLDIGGGHAVYAAAFCQHFPELTATVFDLPEAVSHGSATLEDGLRSRVRFQGGDAMVADFGTDTFDVVLLANVVHHFSSETNAALTIRMAKALRPNGICIILDLIRPASARKSGQLESLLDFYFAAASGAGTWTSLEIANWQRDAGLVPLRLKRLISVPDCGLQIGKKALMGR